MKRTDTTGITFPIDNSVLARLKRGPIELTLRLTLQVETHDGCLHLRASVSRPKVKRRKAGVELDSTAADS